MKLILKPITLILAIFYLPGCTGKLVLENDFLTVAAGLQIQTYGDLENIESPVILMFLHGDGCSADYLKTLAKTVLEKNVISIVMARPGCTVSGRKSVGSHGKSDHYTKSNIDLVANAILSLRQHYNASKVYLVGHSGGAVTAGIIIGSHPDLVEGMVAVAFPANIPLWRKHRNKGNEWSNSLSPHNYTSHIKSSTLIYIVHGKDDANTIPALSFDYVEEVRKRGIATEHVILDGENHNSSIYALKVFWIINDLVDGND